MEIDAGLTESAEFNLACPWGMNLQLATLKVAVVKLDMTRRCLVGKGKTKSVSFMVINKYDDGYTFDMFPRKISGHHVGSSETKSKMVSKISHPLPNFVLLKSALLKCSGELECWLSFTIFQWVLIKVLPYSDFWICFLIEMQGKSHLPKEHKFS